MSSWQLNFSYNEIKVKHTLYNDLYAFQLTSPAYIKVKNVKFTLAQALRLCTGRTAHRGSRGIALLFLDYGTRRG